MNWLVYNKKFLSKEKITVKMVGHRDYLLKWTFAFVILCKVISLCASHFLMFMFPPFYSWTLWENHTQV